MAACYVQPWVTLSHGIHIRMARAALGLTRESFAALCGFKSVKTLKKLEESERDFRGQVESLLKVQRVIDSHRLDLIDDERGIGVIQKPSEPRKKR